MEGSAQQRREERRIPLLSVVIPALDEEDSIAPVVDRIFALRHAFEDGGVDDVEVVVVNDGSRDATGMRASKAGARVVDHPENRGYGAALKTGISEARSDWIAFLDADGTYPPESMPALLAAALDGADIAVGCRMTDADSGMPATRRVGNRLFAGLVSILGAGRVRDCASGMRVFRRDVLSRLEPLPDGLHFTPIMTLRALHEGLRLVEVPISYSERVGQSKLSVVIDGTHFLRSILATAFSYSPVRVLGGFGLIAFAISAAIGLGMLVARLRGVTTLGPLGVAAAYSALVCAVTGVSLFGLGATYNYLLSLLRHRWEREGVFGDPIFSSPLERHFGWLGCACIAGGVALAFSVLALGGIGWPIERLWLYLLGSALLILVGVQMVVSWVLMRTLANITEREIGRRRFGDVGRPPT